MWWEVELIFLFVLKSFTRSVVSIHRVSTLEDFLYEILLPMVLLRRVHPLALISAGWLIFGSRKVVSFTP